MRIPTSRFGRRPPPGLWCLPVLLALGGCGDVGPECGSAEARNAVIKNFSDDSNNRLVNFAVENSDAVEALVKNAGAEAEKSAIREKAKQGAVYSLDNTVVSNARTARAASCTGLLYVSIGDTTVQKEVEYKIEQAAEGKISVSVKPFVF